MAYSTDLKWRVVYRWLMTKESMFEVAKTYQISPSTVKNWIRQFRETGKFESKTENCGRRPKLSFHDREVLWELKREHPDQSYNFLIEELFEKTGKRISLSTVTRYLRKSKKIC